MSLETIEGVEELQRDETDVTEDGDKKLNIHLPTKQVSTSSYGSRRSSFSGLATGGPLKSVKSKESPRLAVKTEKSRKFSTIKEKEKIKDRKKKKRLKSAKRKVSARQNQMKTISDAFEDDNDDEYESDPDVSEIILVKPNQTPAKDEQEKIQTKQNKQSK